MLAAGIGLHLALLARKVRKAERTASAGACSPSDVDGLGASGEVRLAHGFRAFLAAGIDKSVLEFEPLS